MTYRRYIYIRNGRILYRDRRSHRALWTALLLAGGVAVAGLTGWWWQHTRRAPIGADTGLLLDMSPLTGPLLSEFDEVARDSALGTGSLADFSPRPAARRASPRKQDTPKPPADPPLQSEAAAEPRTAAQKDTHPIPQPAPSAESKPAPAPEPNPINPKPTATEQAISASLPVTPGLAGTPPPQPAAAADPARAEKPRTIEVLPGDNLWTLARRAYGDPTKFNLIYEANAHVMKSPRDLSVGQVLIVPDPPPPPPK